MSDQLTAASTERKAFAATIALPYTLTAGPAAGTFLAELANHRILGSRCPECGKISAPAQDFCAACSAETGELVELPETGELVAFTRTHAGLLGLVRLDGADAPFAHRVLDAELEALSIGQRVRARWADAAQGGILDLDGFVVDDGTRADAPEARPYAGDAEPLAELPYRLELEYEHAYGPYYGTLFDELATSRRIMAVKCPSCERALVPPREYCDVCFVRTGEWVDVADTGVIKAFSVIHLEFVGQVREPPYIYAEIVLDGAATRLIHTIGGIDPQEARRTLKPGARVRAVWKEGTEPTGSLEDIDHFALMAEGE
jgi:uncharacterized OB-fold protein